MVTPRNIVHLSQQDITDGRIHHVSNIEKGFLLSLMNNAAISANGFHLIGGGLLSAVDNTLYYVPEDGGTPLIIAMF